MKFTKRIVWILLSGVVLPALGLEIIPLPKNVIVSQALYINCLQRTQTQQLPKAYLMEGMHSTYQHPKQALKVAIPKYDARFKVFDSYFRARIKDAEHVAYLDQASALWKESKVLLETPPSKENGQKLYHNFRKLVKKLGKAKVLAKKSFKAVGMTGGLCRDPLYITNLYLLKLWGVHMPDYDLRMQKAITHFTKNIKKLKAYEGYTHLQKG